MYLLMDAKKCTITPRRAEELLKLNTFEGQRPLSTDTIQGIASKIKDGSFRVADVAKAKQSFNGGHEVIVNGQHTLHGIVLAAKPITAFIQEWDCPTKDDLWKLFGTFDVQRSRTPQHILKAARGLFKSSALQAMPLRILDVCGGALVYLGGGTRPNFGAKTKDRCLKPQLVQQYEKDVVFAARFFTEGAEGMFIQPVVTSIIAASRIDKDACEKFWMPAITGEMLKQSDPQYDIRRKLLYGQFSAKHNFSTYVRNIAIWNLCGSWWNTWRSGEKRNSVKVAAMTKPVDLR